MSGVDVASNKKRKTEICAVKYANGAVVCETDFDKAQLQGLPIGTALKITPISDRNYQHHKKLFSLLEIGFEYWQPDFPIVSESEKWIAYGVVEDICQTMNANETVLNSLIHFANERLKRLKQQRENKLDYEGMKTLMGYLNDVMIKAGFYDIKPVASGGTLKERWSIAFDKCPQELFNEIYKGVFGVIWNETLSNVYQDEWELENKVNQLTGFC